MSGFKWNIKWFAAVLVVMVIMGATVTGQAQVGRRRRRESNANRQARIARSIEDTYSHRWELAGGGGYLRFRSGQYNQRNNEITWETSATYNLNPKWSVFGDIRGMYGNAKINNQINFPVPINGVYRPLITNYTFMVGPQYRFYAKQKFSASAHLIGGLDLGNYDGGTKGITATTLGLWATSNRPVVSAGFNLDYNLYPNLALRLTPTYVGTMFRGINPSTGQADGNLQNNIGVNGSVVFRFGRIRK